MVSVIRNVHVIDVLVNVIVDGGATSQATASTTTTVIYATRQRRRGRDTNKHDCEDKDDGELRISVALNGFTQS